MQSLVSSRLLSNVVPRNCWSSISNGSCSINDLISGQISLLLGGIRLRHSKRVNPQVQAKVEGGIQYYGFTYFPRFPGQVDPPCEPTKLFMVRRIRSVKGCPWWEKDAIEKFNLGSRRKVVIMKNTPRTNAKLYAIKHLIEITPITTPYGMPEDPSYGFLKENGEFVSYNSLGGHPSYQQIEEAKKVNEEIKKKLVDPVTLKKRLHLQWYSRY